MTGEGTPSRLPRLALFEDVHRPPDDLVARARRAERLGVRELWLAEDCFLVGGVAGAAAVLAATEHLRVGIGILPAVTRNPSTTAMELATLARLFPGRLLGGLGHGVPAWMEQIGAVPDSRLEALETAISVIRCLLRGERVTQSTGHWRLEDVALAYPPDAAPPIYAGVRGPRSLAAAARCADGTLLSDWSSPAYVRTASETLRQAGAGRGHELGVIVRTALGDDRQRARDAVRSALRPHLGRADLRVLFDPLAGDHELDPDRPSDGLVEEVGLVGDEETVLAGMRRLGTAGADLLVLRPVAVGDDDTERVHRLMAHVGGHDTEHDRDQDRQGGG